MQECAQESVAAQKYPALVFAGVRRKKRCTKQYTVRYECVMAVKMPTRSRYGGQPMHLRLEMWHAVSAYNSSMALLFCSFQIRGNRVKMLLVHIALAAITSGKECVFCTESGIRYDLSSLPGATWEAYKQLGNTSSGAFYVTSPCGSIQVSDQQVSNRARPTSTPSGGTLILPRHSFSPPSFQRQHNA